MVYTPPTPIQVILYLKAQPWLEKDSLQLYEIRFTKKGPKFLAAHYFERRLQQVSADRSQDIIDLREHFTVYGYKPTQMEGRKLIVMPHDPREFHFSSYLDDRKWSEAERARYGPGWPLGAQFDLAPIPLPKTPEEPYEGMWPERYKRITVDMWKSETPDGGDFLPVPFEESELRPYPFPKHEPQFHGWTPVYTYGSSTTRWFQHDKETALCVAQGESLGIWNVKKAIEKYKRLITGHASSQMFLDTFWVNRITMDESPRRGGPRPHKVTLAELLSMMHPSVHGKLLEILSLDANTGPAKTIAFALYENLDMSSSQLGQRSVMPIGPNWSMKTVEEIVPYINDLPSQRQYVQCWCEIPFNARYNQLE
jgi:hypothetical protein